MKLIRLPGELRCIQLKEWDSCIQVFLYKVMNIVVSYSALLDPKVWVHTCRYDDGNTWLWLAKTTIVELIPHSLVSPLVDFSLDNVEVSLKSVESSAFGLFLIILDLTWSRSEFEGSECWSPHQNMMVLGIGDRITLKGESWEMCICRIYLEVCDGKMEKFA